MIATDEIRASFRQRSYFPLAFTWAFSLGEDMRRATTVAVKQIGVTIPPSMLARADRVIK
jgi:hypothetical protein